LIEDGCLHAADINLQGSIHGVRRRSVGRIAIGSIGAQSRCPHYGAMCPALFGTTTIGISMFLARFLNRHFKTKINVAFRERIAGPLQMQDFRLEDMYYQRASANTAAIARSIHPAYHFRLTARDMARFGYLYLREGKWKDTQVIPADWVKRKYNIVLRRR
jgi:hypothetical protein